MYCNKCGELQPNDAGFCSNCGALLNTKNLECPSEVSKTDRDNVVTEMNMKAIGIMEHDFRDRIDSTNDRKTNDYLFTLYDKLYEPVKKIEDIEDEKKNIEDSIERLSSRPYIVMPDYAWKLGGIINIVFVILVDLICEWTDYLFFWIPWKKWNYSIVCWGMFFGTCFIVGVLLAFLIRQIMIEFKYRKGLLEIPKEKEKKEQISNYQTEIIQKIEPYICFVPREYRCSGALQYFVDSYRNTRVSNLQEAVVAYDGYIRHNQLMASQREIIQGLKDVQESMDDLSYQMAHVDKHLSVLNASIWLSEMIF